MLTVAIKHDGEDKVVDLTYSNLWKELKDIPEAELVVEHNWFDALKSVKTKYICFVEADCLVSSGYFGSQLGLYKKNKFLRKLAMLSSATGVTNWANRFYGYSVEKEWHGTEALKLKEPVIVPSKTKKSSQVYPVQIGYLPGAIIHVEMLKTALKNTKPKGDWNNLSILSTELSLAFWRQGDGNRVHLNPNATYLTTEDYTNDIVKFAPELGALELVFRKEGIS